MRQAMARWPNVPDCYGWLRLTRRGDWRIGEARERITHAGLIGFINRNYGCDARGAWHFQNGPQRVYVSLEYTPLVYRLRDATSTCFETHTGMPARGVSAAWLDDRGGLLLASEHGPGAVLDRDLPALLECLRGGTGETIGESRLTELLSAETWNHDALPVAWLHADGRVVPVGRIRSADAPSFFAFDPAPQPQRLAAGHVTQDKEK